MRLGEGGLVSGSLRNGEISVSALRSFCVRVGSVP